MLPFSFPYFFSLFFLPTINTFAINDLNHRKAIHESYNANVRAIYSGYTRRNPVQADLAFERHRVSFIDVFSASCHGQAGVICSKCVIIKTAERYDAFVESLWRSRKELRCPGIFISHESPRGNFRSCHPFLRICRPFLSFLFLRVFVAYLSIFFFPPRHLSFCLFFYFFHFFFFLLECFTFSSYFFVHC